VLLGVPSLEVLRVSVLRQRRHEVDMFPFVAMRVEERSGATQNRTQDERGQKCDEQQHPLECPGAEWLAPMLRLAVHPCASNTIALGWGQMVERAQCPFASLREFGMALNRVGDRCAGAPPHV